MEIASLISALLLLAAGAAIHYGKMYHLIAGYNTKSKEEQNKIDVQGIGRLMFRCFTVMAAVLLLGALCSWLLQNPVYAMIGNGVAFLGVFPFLLIKANSSQFKRSTDGNT
ncbi:DUF3784 domain-containing protein [Croceiramulus getboli]|nr:DUF3784 domain-containing protein [Flavobacteriaceae bacterium YJPT1-3]